MVASATVISGDRSKSEYTKRLRQPWQDRALWHYENVGEVRYASQFYAKQLSRVRFFPALLGDDGQHTPIETGAPVDLLDRIRDPGGGRSQLQYDYGRLKFVTGELILFGSFLDTPQERWRCLWKDEIKFPDKGGDAIRLNAQRQETNERGTAYRMWTPSPRHSDLADSPMRAVLEICEELVILTASVRGTAVSRLTNGFLVIPQEISPAPDEEGVDDDPEVNPFLEQYIKHVTSQVDNPGTAESKVPFLLEGAYEYLDRVQWIQTHDPAADYLEKDQRQEAIKRLALGLDMPPEALLGMTDANHWTAKQVQHDIWRSHGVPIAQSFASDVNEAYLRPALQQEEYAEWERVIIDYDDSEVVISPDRSEDADKALDRVAIGFKGYRELKGIPEDMAPDGEEKAFLAALKLRDPTLADVEGLGMAPKRGPMPSPNGKPAAEEGPVAPRQGRVVSRQEATTASILGAAEMALRTCRSRAGKALRSPRKGTCEDCEPLINGLTNSLVAAALGAERVQAMFGEDADMMKLVQGGATDFADMLVESGVERQRATKVARHLEAYAAATLFERQPELPPGFVTLIEQGVMTGLAA